jgi:hypothetical protein
MHRTVEAMSQAPLVIVPMASKDAYLSRYAEPDKGWTDLDEARSARVPPPPASHLPASHTVFAKSRLISLGLVYG